MIFLPFLPAARIRLLAFVLIAFVCVVVNATSAAAAPKMANSAKPNIVLILADDLGYGDLGCYGQERIKTPHLDALAKQGVRFTQFYAGAPVCAPSRNVLMTGQHTGHARIRGNAKIDLRPQDFTIGELLQKAGYSTGLIGKWGLGKEGSTGYPLSKGFDYFFGYVDQTMAHNYYPTYLVRNNERVPLRNVVPNPGKYDQGVASVKLDYSADLLAEDAIKFIRDHRERPFFLCFTPTLPHANGEAMPDGMEIPDYGIYAKENWRNQAKGYAAMVTRLDAQVGQMVNELKMLGLDENTLVIFTSDNGPHNEGGNDASFFKSSGPFRGVKRDVYDGGIREPMIVRWPARVPAGATSDHVGYFGDFMATFAQIAGVDAPSGLDSLSFLSALEGNSAAQKSHEYLYWEFYEGASAQAVRMGDWKIVRSPMKTGAAEVYDLKKDPGETRNLATQLPEIVERGLAAMAQAHVESPDWKPGAVSQPGAVLKE